MSAMNFDSAECSCIIQFASLVFVAVGGVFALCQWRRRVKESEARFLKSLLDEFYGGVMVKFAQMVDYGAWRYGDDFHGSELEPLTDQAMSMAAYVCYLFLNKIIDADEFRFFKYDIDRLVDHYGVRDYLYNIHHFARRTKSGSPFCWLCDYGKKTGHINAEEFENPKEWQSNHRYHHYLNW